MKIGTALTIALASVLAKSAALAAVGIASADQFIALPDDPTEGLIVPRESPVRFRRFNQYSRAQFNGRFVLTGSYSYGCALDCEGPQAEKFFAFEVVPDPLIVARLPHWKRHRGGDMTITVDNEKQLVRAVTTSRQRADLRGGTITVIRGRIAIVVDHFEAGLDCDSANYSARFVSFVKAPKLADVDTEGGFGGCG